MTPSLIAAILLSAAAFLLALTAFTLRDFSRRRLEIICDRHNRLDRFSQILIRHERVLLGVDVVTAIVFVCLILVLGRSLALWQLPGTAFEWFELVCRWLVLPAVAVGLLILLPWTLARVVGEKWLFRAWPVLQLGNMLLQPLLRGTLFFDRIVHRLAGVPEPENDEAAVLTEEIRSIVDEGQRGGVIESEAKTMIHRVMELQEDDVADIMTPRTDMVTIPAGATLEEARRVFVCEGFSRVPVIGRSTDDIVGVLYARDLLEHLSNGRPPKSIAEIARDPKYVPETMVIGNLLETMKRDQLHLAIVVDEYSGVAGLVTMEDILEEIVGEIADEYDDIEEEMIHVDSQGRADVDARVHIDDLNERFEYGLPEDGDFDTIGGFAMSEFGRIPKSGESFYWQDIKFTVLDADKRRLHKLRIERLETQVAPKPA